MYAIHYPNKMWSNSEPAVDFDLSKLLVQAGAGIHAVPSNGVTALHLAAEYGEFEIVRYLVDKGANIRATTTSGKSVLHAACSHMYSIGQESKAMAISETLMDHGAAPDLDMTDGSDRTPFQLSFAHHNHAWSWRLDLSNALIQSGASTKFVDQERETFAEQSKASGRWFVNKSGMLEKRPKPPMLIRGGWGRGRFITRGRGRGRWLSSSRR